MTKPTLIIVHGMGEHTEDSFKKEIVDSLNYALGLYDGWKNKKIEALIDIKPFEYNSIFNKYRDKMADAAEPLAKRLDALTAAGLKPVTGEIAKWDADLKKDNFFRTHWLDVLFYRYTMLAEPIRIKLAKLITACIKNKGGENVHILGHSLGTAVVHDTLASLYVVKPDPNKPANLAADAHRLGSAHMVANVSRLLQSFVPVDKSIVHPCKNGCTRAYYQYRHVLDPFTIPQPFEPVANGVWTDPFQLSDMQYQRLRPRLVTDLNTHAVTHYLMNPECHVPFLKKMKIEFWPPEKEIQAAFKEHSNSSLQGKAEMLQQKWDSLKLGNLDDVAAFITAAQSLRDMLASFGQSFK